MVWVIIRVHWRPLHLHCLLDINMVTRLDFLWVVLVVVPLCKLGCHPIGAINGSGMKRTLPTNEVSPMRLYMHLRKFSCWLFLDLNLCAFWCDEKGWHNSTWQEGLPFQCDNEGPPLLAMLKIWFDLMRRAVSSLPHWNLCFEVKGKIGLLSLSRIVGFR